MYIYTHTQSAKVSVEHSIGLGFIMYISIIIYLLVI